MFQLLAAVSVFFIFISITSFCLKTHPAMRVPTVSVHSAAAAATSCPCGVNTTGVGPGAPPRPRPRPPTVTRRRDEPHAAFFYVDSVCNAWFAVEVVVRLATSPRPWRLLRSPHNLIDMTATLSFYLDLVLTRLQVDRSDTAHTQTDAANFDTQCWSCRRPCYFAAIFYCISANICALRFNYINDDEVISLCRLVYE